jgi:glycosyltransferase involved in cell wall biosynthesis
VGVGRSEDFVRAFALSAARPSASFREEAEVRVGPIDEIVLIPELRRLGPTNLLRRLRSLSGACVVIVEDPGAVGLLPVLEALAALTRARTIEVVLPDLSTRRIGRMAGIASVTSLTGSAIHGHAALRRARRELAVLAQTSRVAASVRGTDVLHLNPNLWFGVKAGGSVSHVAGVVNALVASGHAVTLASAIQPVGVSSAVDVVRLRTPSIALPAESNFYRYAHSIPPQLDAVPQPSFLYQRHAVASYAGVVVSRARRVPLVLEYNGSEVWASRHWSRPLTYEQLALAAENASLQHAHLIVTVSEVLADQLVDRGVEPERIVWHPNGVDPDPFDPKRFSAAERTALRSRYGIPDDAVVATFVGTFGEWHGVPMLAQAARRLTADPPAWARDAKLRFLFVGDGPTMPDVRAELRDAGDGVTLAGLVPAADVPLHLMASDILVSPHVGNPDGTPFFGSPTKLFEYMAAGKAIVASDLDQIGEILRDRLAVLVRPGDADDLIRGIRDVATNEELRDELGARARSRVLERYTWRHQVDAILAALATRST